MKICAMCGVTKPLDEFVRVKARDGRPGSYCRPCNTARCRDYAQNNREKRNAYHREYDRANKERRQQWKKERHAKSPRDILRVTLLHGIRRRPTENPCTLDEIMGKFFAQRGRCAVTGIQMTWAKGTVLPTSLSIDRIDPTEGYSCANIRLVCHAVNAFKGRMNDGEMIDMAKAIVANREYRHYEPGLMEFA